MTLRVRDDCRSVTCVCARRLCVRWRLSAGDAVSAILSQNMNMRQRQRQRALASDGQVVVIVQRTRGKESKLHCASRVFGLQASVQVGNTRICNQHRLPGGPRVCEDGLILSMRAESISHIYM